MSQNQKPRLILNAVIKFEHDGEERSHWIPIGALIPNSKGGYAVKWDLIPQNLSEVELVAMPVKDREGQQQ